MLAEHYGVAEVYDNTGAEVKKQHANQHTPPERAYDIGVLRALIAHLAAEDSKILPSTFRSSLIFLDLENMLSGAAAEGLGDPQVLYSNSAGDRHNKMYARIFFVCCVHYQAAKIGKPPEQLLSYFGANHLSKKNWKDWCRYAGEEKIAHAEQEAAQKNPGSPYEMSREEVSAIFEKIAPNRKS